MSLARGCVGVGPTCCGLASAPPLVGAPGLPQTGLLGPPLLGDHQPRAPWSTLTKGLCELGPQDPKDLCEAMVNNHHEANIILS